MIANAKRSEVLKDPVELAYDDGHITVVVPCTRVEWCVMASWSWCAQAQSVVCMLSQVYM